MKYSAGFGWETVNISKDAMLTLFLCLFKCPAFLQFFCWFSSLCVASKNSSAALPKLLQAAVGPDSTWIDIPMPHPQLQLADISEAEEQLGISTPLSNQWLLSLPVIRKYNCSIQIIPAHGLLYTNGIKQY